MLWCNQIFRKLNVKIKLFWVNQNMNSNRKLKMNNLKSLLLCYLSKRQQLHSFKTKLIKWLTSLLRIIRKVRICKINLLLKIRVLFKFRVRSRIYNRKLKSKSFLKKWCEKSSIRMESLSWINLIISKDKNLIFKKNIKMKNKKKRRLIKNWRSSNIQGTQWIHR